MMYVVRRSTSVALQNISGSDIGYEVGTDIATLNNFQTSITSTSCSAKEMFNLLLKPKLNVCEQQFLLKYLKLN